MSGQQMLNLLPFTVFDFDSGFDFTSHGKSAEQRRLIRKYGEKLFERSEFFSPPD